MQIPTVKIEGENGDYIVINEEEFDESKQKLFVEKEEKSLKPKDDKNPKDAVSEKLKTNS